MDRSTNYKKVRCNLININGWSVDADQTSANRIIISVQVEGSESCLDLLIEREEDGRLVLKGQG